MAQPVVSNSWDSTNVSELPRINPNLSPLVMNNSGVVGSSGSVNMQNSTSHNVLNAQAANPSPYIPHGLPNAANGLCPNIFGTPTTNNGLSFSRVPDQFATLPQYLHSNDSFPNMQTQFGGSVSLDSMGQSQYGNHGSQGSEFSQASFQRPSAATGQTTSPFVPPNTYYQDMFPYPAQALQQLMPYQNMAHVPHPANTQSATLGTTGQDIPAAPSLNRQSSFRTRPYGQFPQAGVSPTSTSIHHRRHRTHSIASSAPSAQQQHGRASSQGVHLRTRSIREPHTLNGISPHIHRNHTTMAGTSHVLPNAGSEAQLPPPLTQQEQVELARRLQMRELLRSARSNENHALRLHEENYLRHRRQQEEAVSHAKGLDNQKDGRPEPKDDKELTVNLECKICMSQLVDTVLIPCGHAILCRWCAEQHARSNRSQSKAPVLCPLCRTPVKQKLRIYLS
ncbi:hypothetical protein BDV26DRAFT_278807 [Aspergillus bertholletiae]|uniref:RING-type domain-containing protein n=1 Tax=Aspergillus bertholletiae TaxID=1226010 RepID=A0A5N7BI86_9EURO|nr:hypothetical protein BDV26DRAFT_278807 [Aspergillus bertholletiae]